MKKLKTHSSLRDVSEATPNGDCSPTLSFAPLQFSESKGGLKFATASQPKERGFQPGHRLLLESVQIGKCQRSEIKAEAPVTARPHSGLEGGGNLPRVPQKEHNPAGGAARLPAASPSPARPSTQASCSRGPHLLQSFWEYSQFTLEHRNRNASENGARGPSHHTFPFWGCSSCVPLPWATQTQSHGVLTAVAVTIPPALHCTGAHQWGWLSNWESQRDRLGVQTREAERPGFKSCPCHFLSPLPPGQAT